MPKWKVDEEFLEYVLSNLDLNDILINSRSGPLDKLKELADCFDEMKIGTRFGRSMYHKLHNNPDLKFNYAEYKMRVALN